MTHNTSISRYVSRYSFLKPVTDEPLKSLHEEVAVDELGLISDAKKVISGTYLVSLDVVL